MYIKIKSKSKITIFTLNLEVVEDRCQIGKNHQNVST